MTTTLKELDFGVKLIYHSSFKIFLTAEHRSDKLSIMITKNDEKLYFQNNS